MYQFPAREMPLRTRAEIRAGLHRIPETESPTRILAAGGAHAGFALRDSASAFSHGSATKA